MAQTAGPKQSPVAGAGAILLSLSLAALWAPAPAVGQEPAPIPVQEARRDDNRDFVPDRLGETVTLAGVMTTDTRYVQRGSLANLQDATGGILLYCRENARMAGLHRGDRVQVRGKIGQYRGAEQLEVEEIVRLGEGDVPRPRNARAVELHSERYSGQLVRVVGDLRVPPNLLATLDGLALRDSSGEIPININRRFLEEPKFVERLLRGDRVELIGIARQSKLDPPYNSGYELMPRDPADFHFVPVPPYQTIALLALSLLVSGVIVHLWLRRRVAEKYAREMQELSESLKRSEQALRASESRLRSIIETEQECVKLVAADGTLLEMNPAGLAMIEAERPADVVGQSVYTLVVPEHREAFRQLTETVARGQKAKLEFEMVGLKGTRRWMETHAVPLRDGLEGHSLVLGVTRDITERKRAEEALRASEEKFHKAFHASPDALILSTLGEGRFLEVNDSFLRLSGYQREEVIGRLGLELGVWENPEERKLLVKLLREHGRVQNFEAHFRAKSGRFHEAIISAEVIQVGGDQCVLWAARDITERKQAEKKLEERTAHLNALIENSPLAIVVHDLEGRVQMCNPAFERLFQYPQSEMVGALVDELIAPEPWRSEAAEFTRRCCQGQSFHATTRRRRKDGTLVDVELHGVPLLVQGKLVGAYGLYQDVGERRRLEDQLRQSQKMEALGLLAGGIAHDFNNAAGAILGWAELGLKEAAPDHPVRKRLQRIRDQARHTAELTRQLLAFASRQILEPRKTSLNQTVSSVVGLLENVIGEDIEVRTELTPDLWDVRADASQLEQVLMNLCLNARDAMPQGGCLRIETQNVDFNGDADRHPVHIRAGRHVLLSVSDTGVGMDGAVIKRMFEPFYTTKGSGIGSGLGLAVVYGIVKQHDGFIYVSSEPGRGTAFRVYLPVGEEAPAPEPEARKPEQEPVRGGRETILVAEDHEGAREVAQETLEALGYQVLLARDGEEALRLFHEHRQRIGMVLLDVALPKISGPDLYTRIQAAQPELRVVFITGYSSEAKMLSSLIEKGAAVLQKPYSPDELGQKVRQTLDCARAR